MKKSECVGKIYSKLDLIVFALSYVGTNMLSFNPIHATGLFLYPLKSSKPQGFGCFQGLAKETGSSMKWVHPLSANPTKWSNTRKLFVAKKSTNCLSVFDHFVGLALKGLK